MAEPTPTTDHTQCAALIRAIFAEHGGDVHVSIVPPIVVGPHPTEAATCPHGATFYIEPTGEQIAAWARGEATSRG